jgi:hypothetical protein
MVAWLRNDLAADSAKRRTLAHFHHPFFSSGGEHDDQPQVRPIWGSLYAANAAVVVSGHDHLSSASPPKGPTARSTERGASASSWWGRVARR